MADATLHAQTRTEFGKGASRRVRRDHKVPAVVYGQHQDPIHLVLPGHETMLALRMDNALIELRVEGESKPRLALVKQVQRDPIKGELIHVDLLTVRADEKVVVEVALVIVGESAPDTTVVSDQNSIQLEAPVSDIPEEIQISVEGLEPGTQIFAKDLDLPAGVTFPGEPDDLMVSVNHAEENEVPEPTEGEETAAAEGAGEEAAEEE